MEVDDTQRTLAGQRYISYKLEEIPIAIIDGQLPS